MNNQNGPNDEESRDNQNEIRKQSAPYGDYIPDEIPIPYTKGREEYNTDQTQNAQQPFGQNNAYQIYGPQGQAYIPDRRNSATIKILIAVVCVMVVIFTVVGIGIAYFRSTPAYKISRGILNLSKEIEQSKNPLEEKIGLGDMILMMAEEGGHVDSRINFTMESLFGTTVGIDTEYYKDMQNKELSADTSVSVMNYDFAHLNIYADEEALCFSIPELFMENLYIDNEDVVSQYNKSFLAELTGISDADDFSLDFFADEKGGLSLLAERYAADLEACRDEMVMEKAGKGVYRMVYPAREMDRLLRHLADSSEGVYGLAGEDRWWKEYDSLIDSNISVLLEIDRQNRIESISFEEPVALMDGTASMTASLHFLGTGRSIDKMQGEITVEGKDGAERAIHFQILQTPAKDSYKIDMDVELMEEKDSMLRIKYVADSDAVRDEFDMSFSVWDDETDIEMIVEGSMDDIVKGRSLELDLTNAVFRMDGEELFKITGELLIEPLEDEITSTVRKEKAFFEMTENDWLNILYAIDREYGGLLNYLW